MRSGQTAGNTALMLQLPRCTLPDVADKDSDLYLAETTPFSCTLYKGQLRAIKKELGIEKEDKTLDIEKFQKRLEERTPSEDVLKVITEEMEKDFKGSIVVRPYIVKRGA